VAFQRVKNVKLLLTVSEFVSKRGSNRPSIHIALFLHEVPRVALAGRGCNRSALSLVRLRHRLLPVLFSDKAAFPGFVRSESMEIFSSVLLERLKYARTQQYRYGEMQSPPRSQWLSQSMSFLNHELATSSCRTGNATQIIQYLGFRTPRSMETRATCHALSP
jgi:hypothetical protein